MPSAPDPKIGAPAPRKALDLEVAAGERDDIWVTPKQLKQALANNPPSGSAGGVLDGFYPNPGFAVDMAEQSELNAEKVERADADVALGNTIQAVADDLDAETAARIDADQNLQQQIDDLPAGVTLSDDPAQPLAATAGAGTSNEAARADHVHPLPLLSASPIYPRTGANYSFGDSQTEGVNSANQPYTSGGLLLEEYRWPTVFSKMVQLLGPNNFAIGGSRISWGIGFERSHFNQLRELPYNWRGTLSIMPCWNNLGQVGTYDANFYKWLRRGGEAVIARGFITDWDALTTLGWNRSDGQSGATPGLVTVNVSNASEAASYFNPFPYGPNPSSNYRYWMVMGSGESSIEFTTTSHRANALFFEAAPDGGPFEVYVNDVLRGTYDSNFTGPLSDIFPFNVWLDNLPNGTATIRIYRQTGSTGTVRFLARGILEKDASVWDRLILYASPSGNDGGANTRPPEQLAAAYVAAMQAVGAFCEAYPAAFVDTQVQWDEERDQEPEDPSHTTERGSIAIARQFTRAITPPAFASDTFIRL